MKKLVITTFLLLSMFIISCSLLGPGDNSLPASNLILSADAGDNLVLLVYSFPSQKDIGENTPINLQIYIKNGNKEDISGIMDISDNIYDSGDYGGIQGTKSTEFTVLGVESAKGAKLSQIQEISNIRYNRASEIKNVVFSFVLNTAKQKELLSSPFCIKQKINDNIANCDSHPRLSFVDSSSTISLSDFEFFGSTGTDVDKIKFTMNLNENSRCTIIKDDLTIPELEEGVLDQSDIVKTSASLVQSNVFFDCRVNPTKSANQKIIICDNTNDLTFTQNYYTNERIKAELSYGCRYLFTTNIDLLKKEEVR